LPKDSKQMLYFLRLRGVMDTPAHDNFVGTMNGAGGANMATNAGGGGQLERQIPSFQQQWLMMQQQQAAQAAVPAVVPSAAPDTMQLILNLTQSVESLTKKVEGQQKSAS
jgi:hypothetical protein